MYTALQTQSQGKEQTAMNRPNILYIHSHDTGRYIQPYGHNVPTPNMPRSKFMPHEAVAV